jgi:hypothetical protein
MRTIAAINIFDFSGVLVKVEECLSAFYEKRHLLGARLHTGPLR